MTNTNFNIVAPRLDYELQAFFKPFLKEQDLNNKTLFIEMSTDTVGVYHHELSKDYIFIPDGFKEIDRDGLICTLKHEIGHIKHDYKYWCDLSLSILPVVLLTSIIAFGVFFPMGYPIIMTVAIIISLISITKADRLKEERADDFAFTHSSVEELRGGWRVFKAETEMQKDMRTKNLFYKLLIAPNGDSRFTSIMTHPSESSRMKKIENELLRRGSSLGEIDWEKILKLKKLFASHKEIPSEHEEAFLEAIESKEKLLAELKEEPRFIQNQNLAFKA